MVGLPRVANRYTLQYTASHCNALQHTAAHCNILQHTATRLQRTTTRCTATQHTASVTGKCHATHGKCEVSQASVTGKCDRQVSHDSSTHSHTSHKRNCKYVAVHYGVQVCCSAHRIVLQCLHPHIHTRHASVIDPIKPI